MREINLEKEREYENTKTLSDEVRKAQNKYYWATDIPTQEHKQQTYAAIKGLSGLEIGCSSGYDAVEYGNQRLAVKYLAYEIRKRIDNEIDYRRLCR